MMVGRDEVKVKINSIVHGACGKCPCGHQQRRRRDYSPDARRRRCVCVRYRELCVPELLGQRHRGGNCLPSVGRNQSPVRLRGEIRRRRRAILPTRRMHRGLFKLHPPSRHGRRRVWFWVRGSCRHDLSLWSLHGDRGRIGRVVRKPGKQWRY